MNRYSQDEINMVLLNKEISDFYLVIVENRGEILTDEEYTKLLSHNPKILTEDKIDASDIIKEIEVNENLKNFVNEIKMFMMNFATARFISIATVINGSIYLVNEQEFLDIKKNKIIKYANVLDYFNPNDCSLVLVKPNQIKGVKKACILFDSKDVSGYYEFESENIDSEKNDDLTFDFIYEVEGPKLTINRRKRKI